MHIILPLNILETFQYSILHDNGSAYHFGLFIAIPIGFYIPDGPSTS